MAVVFTISLGMPPPHRGTVGEQTRIAALHSYDARRNPQLREHPQRGPAQGQGRQHGRPVEFIQL